MKINIIFPRRFFTSDQLGRLGKYDLNFYEGKNIDLDKIKDLFSGEENILSIDPTYVKDDWGSLNNERLARMKGTKAICLATTSYSWVDLKKAKELGIIVTNTPGKSTEAVAEFNIYMMMSLLRKIPLIVKNDWQMDYDHFLNEEAKGLTAGIIGLGKIGSRVAELCHGMGMKVIYWNRSRKKSSFRAVGLDSLCHTSDVIFTTISTPPEIKGLVEKELVLSMKKNAMLINTSSVYDKPDSHVYDMKLVIDLVAKNKLGGFAFESHSAKTTDFKGNVMVFPEQAYYTCGTMENTARIVTETIISVIEGRPINQVNPPRP